MNDKPGSREVLGWSALLLVGLLGSQLAACGGTALEVPGAGAGGDNAAVGGALGQAGAAARAGSPSSAGAGAAVGQAGAIGKGGSPSYGGSDVGVSGSETGGAGGDCYSPTQNEAAFFSGVGCDCDPSDTASVCVNDVPLICSNGTWQAVYDGQCALEPPPPPPPYYTVDSCKAAGGVPVTTSNCASGSSLGTIGPDASPGWSDGGLCCAGFSNPGKSCGGILGGTCAADEYCAYAAGQLCGAADASAFCRTRPEACPDLYAPVCGCDQKTYDNSCVANAAGTGIFAAGACPVTHP